MKQQSSSMLLQEDDAKAFKKKYRITQMFRCQWCLWCQSRGSCCLLWCAPCDSPVRRCLRLSSAWRATSCGAVLMLWIAFAQHVSGSAAIHVSICAVTGVCSVQSEIALPKCRCPAIINVGDPGQAKKATG